MEEEAMAELVADAELSVEAVTEEETRTEEFEVTEFGLKLHSTGEISWGQWQGRMLLTPQDREVMVETLKKTAPEVGLDVEEYLSKFSWVARTVHVTKTYSTAEAPTFPIDAPEFLGQVADA
jgi:hypothetical protein